VKPKASANWLALLLFIALGLAGYQVSAADDPPAPQTVADPGIAIDELALLLRLRGARAAVVRRRQPTHERVDALLQQLRTEGVHVDDRVEEYEYGRFGWIMDPEGHRIELWEPPRGGETG